MRRGESNVLLLHGAEVYDGTTGSRTGRDSWLLERVFDPAQPWAWGCVGVGCVCTRTTRCLSRTSIVRHRSQPAVTPGLLHHRTTDTQHTHYQAHHAAMFARPAVADENAGAAVFGRVRDALHGPKDSGLAGIQPQLGGNAGGKSGFGGGAQQLTARKALGNITNARGPAAAGGSSLLLGKPTAAQQQQQELKGAPPRGPQPPPRRAFGDLTNSLGGAKQALGASSLPKPVSSQQQQQQPGSQAVVAAQQELPRHEAYAADGGVERMAGKGWRQMEAERLAAQDIAINRRVSMVTSTMASAWASSPNQFLPVRMQPLLAGGEGGAAP